MKLVAEVARNLKRDTDYTVQYAGIIGILHGNPFVVLHNS